MEPRVPMGRFHVELVKDLFREPLEHEDVLGLMLLLHACRMQLADEARVAGEVRGFEGVTTRHAAEVAASLFSSGHASDPNYWYKLWNGAWDAYGILENPPDRLAPTLRRIRTAIESHPWVERLADEDWEILPSRD